MLVLNCKGMVLSRGGCQHCVVGEVLGVRVL